MKKRPYRFVRPVTPVVVMAAVLAAVFFTWANLLMAASPNSETPTKVRRSPVERTDARIKDLENALKITPEQQGAWKALTQVMQENAKTQEALIQARKENSPKMNAVDDIKSYSQIVEAQVEGLKKFIPAFEALYAGMSDEQKKNADVLFKMGRHGKQRKQ
jgi:periplasmic protein CpxP/Spy